MRRRAAGCGQALLVSCSRHCCPGAGTNLEPEAENDTKAVFLAAIEPRLPSVDRMAHHVRTRLRDDASAKLEVCVSPAGNVTKVAMIKGTTYEPFDAALLRDAEAWQFASMPGPANLQTCEQVSVTYLAPR